ncbi:hypothetical protein PCO31110_04593 [Pandoraea communis]|uniref:Uncharacterized protein n=1 Tax=Pandoraea communis TaxID=2508297 RepID=A0A5E4YIJ6_9BURK|nr:hypothetical protein PCO31110_04593 [Pandoraea communis]
MKSLLTRIQSTSPIRKIGLALVMLGVFAPSVPQAQPGYRDQGAHHDMRQGDRHDRQRAPYDHRYDRPRHYNGYGDGGYGTYGGYGGYAYGPPPVVYAPPVSPGVTLFFPLEFR